MKKLILSCSFLLVVQFTVFSQNEFVGKWLTIDDETEKPKSIVELYIENGELNGKVIELILTTEEDQNPMCTECDGTFNGKPILGMKVLTDMEFDADDVEWSEGEILDPENGTTYDCKMWLEDGELKVRGYVSFFFRTQTWTKVVD